MAALLAALLAALSGLAPARAAGIAAGVTLVSPAPGVHVHVGRIAPWDEAADGDVANLGLVVGDRCAAVIDTGGSPRLGAAFAAAVRAVTDRPVCWIVRTHAHPDHGFGEAAFANDTPRHVAAATYDAAWVAREGYWRRALPEPAPPAAPTRIAVPAGKAVSLDLGNRTLEVRAWTTAHTDSDVTVFDAASGTLFTGDLLFGSHLPVIDGSVRGWQGVTASLAAVDARTSVPGHGPICATPCGAWAAQARYLDDLVAGVRAALHAQLSLSETVAALPAPAGWRLAETFHRRNVTTTYAELEWE